MADRKITIALAFLGLMLVVTDIAAQFEPNTWLFRDGRFYTNVNENLLLAGSLEDPFAASWYDGNLGWNRNLPADFSNVALGARGEHYHFRPWILPVLSTPFYFAFGLLGVLIFNALLYTLVAAATFRFVRAYTDALPAAVVAVAMVLASGFRHHIYNYSVDMLLVTLFLCGLWALMEKRGVLAGVLIAATVMIKPTTLLYAPALALVMWERRDGRTLLRAVGGGSGLLALYGCVNWYMFGRPWWMGYARVLTVVDGVETVHNDTSSFATPLIDGAWELLSGGDGVVWWHGLFVLALPGLAIVLRHWPRTGLAILLSSIGAFALFSKFAWHHDRFLFPSVALLSLPLALGMDGAARGFRSALREVLPLRRSGALVFVVALVALLASAFTGGELFARHPDEAAVQGAIALGERSFDLQGASSDVTVTTAAEHSTVSLTRAGTWVPRANPIALLPFAPVAHLAGRHGVLFGSALAAAGLCAALAWLLRRRLSTPMAAAVAIGALLVGPVRDAALGRPIETLCALLLVVGLARASTEGSDARGPFVASAVAVALAGVVLEQPLLGAFATGGVVLLARYRSPDLVLPTLLAGLGTCALGMFSSWVLWGSPLGTADDAVVVAADGSALAMSGASAIDALARLGEEASPSRAVLPLVLALPFAIAGLLVDRRRDRRLVTALLVLVGALSIPGVAMRGHVITPLAVFALLAVTGVALGVLAEGLAEMLARNGSRRVLLAGAASLLVILLGAGLARRAQAHEARFWIGTPRSVRDATVSLGDAPCDFLAWENMAWECAMLDGGAMGRVGLALPESPQLQGRSVPGMLLIPTGLRRGDPRRVRWEHVAATDVLHLVVGAPDGEFTSGAQVTIRVDGTEVGTFEVTRDERGLRDRVLDTASFEGREVSLEIELSATRRGQQAAILVAGGFVARD